MTTPATLSFAGFAALNRWKRSYVTQLKRDNRLILTEDGKAVRVAESLARIRQTADPSKAGVKARHAAARSAPDGHGSTTAPATTDAASGAPEAESREPDIEPGDEGFQYWRRRSEKAKALAAERENAIAEGKLMDAGEVAAAIGSAATALRVRLEALPDTLGPQLAAMTDENQVRATLTESIEHALEECARQFATLAKQQAQA
jgi:hypothetical protein